MIASLLAAAIAVQSAAAPVTFDFSNASAQPGKWTYAALPGGSDATFVDAMGAPRLVIHCNRPLRRVSISRVGSAPATSLALWTSSASRNIAARYDAATQRATVELAALDPLLDAIAFSRGRIAVSMPGYAPLVLPAWPEPARAVEDCRS
jgi:hypothetical protein